MGYAAQIIALVVSLSIHIFLLRRKKVLGAYSLFAFAGAMLVADAAAFVTTAFPAFFPGFMFGLGYLSVLATLTMLFVFVLEYTRRTYWLTPANAVILSLQPVLTLCVVWFGPLEWSFTGIDRQNLGNMFPNGPWMSLITIYGEFLVFLTILFLVRTYHGTFPFRKWSGLVILGAFPPVLFPQLVSSGITVQAHLTLYLLAISFTGSIFVYVFIHKGLLDTLPVPREVVVDNMSDGWMVVDNGGQIVDLNSIAELVVGNRDALLGQNISTVLSDWSSIVDGTNEGHELKLKGYAGRSGERTLDVSAIEIDDQRGTRLGRLILWRDITQKIEREQARLRVQNEMYGLMYSIVGEATRSQTLENFINSTIQQILHVFRCESGVAFLVDEEDFSASPQLFLAAHYGLPVSSENKMYAISSRSELIAELIATREPICIPDVKSDVRIAESMGMNADGTMLLVPMLSESRLIGVMGLMRKVSTPFSRDEILRVSSMVEHVANFVSGDRRRQLSIAISERQKLVRDLHDSVTQKLYGLVAFTEAAEAGLEAGSMDMLVKVLPRISENARQSLKEMRLFLHGLQPVDLEREGLEAVLHQRLAAVEGRADIKARFTFDDDIVIPLEKQVALYFIAQEALNNVLKHARASSVTVHLSQSRSNIVMEIEDDGCGFDTIRVKQGGMGIRNMQQRAKQVGGNIKISSSHNKGTIVKISVPKEITGKSVD